MRSFLSLFLILISLPVWAADSSTDDQKMMQDLKLRRQYLDWHQYTAWATAGLMVGALATAPEGGTSSTHKWLGIGAGGMYLTSATLAYLAPKVEGMNEKDNIMIHKKLIWIHAPAMALTVAAGLSAHHDRENGKKESSFSKLHKVAVPVALVSFTAAAFMSTDWGMSVLPASKKDIAWVLTKTF